MVFSVIHRFQANLPVVMLPHNVYNKQLLASKRHWHL